MPLPPPDHDLRPGARGVATARLVIVAMLCGLQYWLLTATMEAFHGGDRTLPLAAAIASFVNILDPETLILGGGIARAGETLFQPLREFLDPVEWRPGGQRVKLLPAELGEFAGAFGAAHHALKQMATD